jgi:hypothetical protein
MAGVLYGQHIVVDPGAAQQSFIALTKRAADDSGAVNRRPAATRGHTLI